MAIIRCPKCGNFTRWIPLAGQRKDEDLIGPFDELPPWIKQRPDIKARLSQPISGQRYLFFKRQKGQKPSYWPAELNCAHCQIEGSIAVWANNLFLRRIIR